MMLRWLKEKARAWSAPEYSQMSATYAEAIKELAEAKAHCSALTLENARARADLVIACRETGALQAKLAQATKPKFITEHADDAPPWTPEMADAWRHFLAGNEAGKALQRLGNHHEQQTNRAAVFRTSGAEANAGYARGWHDCTAYFFKTLSADVRPQQDTDTQAPDDAGALRERLAS